MRSPVIFNVLPRYVLNQKWVLERMCSQYMYYRKNSKNWDTLNYHRDCPTNGILAFYSAILRSKDSDRITNRVDTDQTAPCSRH